jgi:hypothetical protein
MPPYIGKGITVELLTDVVAFLVGPCSCFAKAENPGMDLLARWDWEATADKMAANDPSLYPDAMMYQEFAVDDMEEEGSLETTNDVSPDLAAATAASSAKLPAATDAAAVTEGEMSSAEPSPKEKTETLPPADEADQPKAEKPANVQVERAEGPVSVPVDSDESASSFATGITWRLALGLALGAAAVVVAGFVLIRKQG